MNKLKAGVAAIALLILTSVQLSAKTCNLKSDFDKKTLRRLKRASKVPTIGLLRLAGTKREYEVDVLHSDQANKYVVLLGEIHIKRLISSLRGKSVVKRFQYRFLEGVPAVEGQALKSTLGWQRTLLRIITFRFWGSTIHYAGKRGLYFGQGDLDTVFYNKRPLEDYRETEVKGVADIAEIYPTLGMQYRVGGQNFPLEIGPYLKPSNDDSYILHARNRRMVANLHSYLTEVIPEVDKSLVVVGAAHNPGLAQLLAQQGGYERCSNF